MPSVNGNSIPKPVKKSITIIVSVAAVTVGGTTAASVYNQASSSAIVESEEDYNNNMLKNTADTKVDVNTFMKGVSSDYAIRGEFKDLDFDSIYQNLDNVEDWDATAAKPIDTDLAYTLYDTPPLAKNDKSFFTNIHEAESKMWQIFTESGASDLTVYKPWDHEDGMDIHHYAEVKSFGRYKGGSSTTEKDGITYLNAAIGYSNVMPKYYKDLQWLNEDAYPNRVPNISEWPQVVAVFYNKSDHSNAYMPINIIDAKAHTFPMGFIQTCLISENDGDGSVLYAAGDDPKDAGNHSPKSDFAHKFGKTDLHDNFIKAWKSLETDSYSTPDGNPPQCPISYISTIEIRNDHYDEIQDFNSQYGLCGFIVIPDDDWEWGYDECKTN